jgi:hypothetical protein
MINGVCFSLSIQHYVILIDKCHLLDRIIVEIHPFGILDELSLSPSATISSSPWFNGELLFREPVSIVHFPRILQCHLVDLCCTFLLGHLESEVPGTNQIWISVRHDGWNIILGIIILVLWWPGKVLSCLAPLVGGLSIIVSFFCKVSHSSSSKL